MEAESPDWSRGSCDHVTTEHDYQSVICQCSSWKMFLAVTQVSLILSINFFSKRYKMGRSGRI